jgi:hypothetical protein
MVVHSYITIVKSSGHQLFGLGFNFLGFIRQVQRAIADIFCQVTKGFAQR